MKRFISPLRYLPIAVCALMAVSCATPQVMRFNVDVLQPVKFNLDVEDQSTAIIATYSTETQDSIAIAGVALGAARFLETENALEDGDVGAFIIPQEEYKGTQDKDYMEGLMMETGRSCLVILSNISFGNGTIIRKHNPWGEINTSVIIPSRAFMDVYDAISDTTLFSTIATDSIQIDIPYEFASSQQDIQMYMDSTESLVFTRFGAAAVQNICPYWKTEIWNLFDYPTISSWHKAYMNARNFRWQEAITNWMPFTEEKDAKKASLAAFNIAVACQIMGENELAASWISFCRGKLDFKEAAQLQQYIKSKQSSNP